MSSPKKVTAGLMLIEGKTRFIDAHGKPIKMDEKRIELAIRFSPLAPPIGSIVATCSVGTFPAEA
jgi:hypothetical protein